MEKKTIVIIVDPLSNFTQFKATFWAEHTVGMEENLENDVFGLKEANVKILKKNTDNIIKSHGCNQCNFVFSHTRNLRTHLKTHSGEKPNKCNQCDYASSEARNLRRHLKMHSGAKSNKCNQCDFASSHISNLRAHIKNNIICVLFVFFY